MESYFNPDELKHLASYEGDHYWHLARRELIDLVLRGLSSGPALDVGCGPGTLTTFLNERGHRVDYADVHPEALRLARVSAPNDREFLELDIVTAVPPRYATILLLDVIEHLSDDVAALRNARAACDRVLVTVPAFPVLWSAWDEAADHKRRYTRATLRRSLDAAGFRVDRIGYFFAPLFVASGAVQLVRKFRPPSTDGLEGLAETKTSPMVTRAACAVLGLERPFARAGLVPFGTSLFAVAS